MRITRLTLARYGHLSDVDLVFPPAPGMHIVLGANEAGKSTALAAIGDALFRFPTRTAFAFAHATRDLRLGIALQAADGRGAGFVRRKGNKDDLLDEAGQPVPESAIASFLAGAGRERFQHLFGLDAATLRSGGQAILEGKGELGESLLQAHTGLHGFRALVERLGEDASRLFGDRRGRRELHVAVDRYKEAKAALEDRTVEPADYKARREEQDTLEAARAARAVDSDRLHAERARLDRIRRTAPARLAAAHAREERAALGDVPALPADAEAVYLAAIAARERASHDLAGLGVRAEGLAASLAALIVDGGLLAEGEAIDALAADRSHIAKTAKDRAEQGIVALQHERALAQAAQRLGHGTDMAEIAARIPDALTRASAERAILAHAKLSERHARAREDLDAARAHHEAAIAALAGLAEPLPSTDPRAAIDRAKSEGRIDSEREAAIHAEETAAAELARLLAALPLWSGSADALAAIKVPLDAMIAERATALERSEAARRSAEDKVAGHDATLAGIAADLRGMTEAGDLPTPSAIAALRERRDRAWRLLRRHRIDGGATPDPAELAGLAPLPALPDLFEGLLREADALVDRGATEAKRVAAFEQLRVRQSREQAARDSAAELSVQAIAGHEAARLGWEALWSEAGIAPQAPAAMREWLGRRDGVLAQRTRLGEAATRRAALAARHAAARAALASVLPDAASDGAPDTVAALLVAAERLRAARDDETEAWRKARTTVETAQSATEKCARALGKAESDLAAWATEWARAAASLGLAADAAPDSGKLALDLWSGIEREFRACQTATDRIAQMTAAIDAFGTDAAAIAARVAPDLAGADPQEIVRVLAARLATSRSAAAERAKLTEERNKLLRSIGDLTARRDQAQGQLAVLHAIAGTADDAALREAIARTVAHTALTARIADREAELRRLDDGKSLPELEAEAGGIDLDTLPGRIAEIETRLRALAAEDAVDAERLAGLRLHLAAMQAGRDAAGAAQDMADALGDIDDIAARYVRTRLAHTLLRAGIDTFRRQQQAPLLARAGALFARLTEGRYGALGVHEDDDGKLSIVAERPDGSSCPADRLSEGTRDQLYLALRLAAIESYAERTEPLPFIADDLLVNFDDRRARAALKVLGEMAARVQVILFTHHAHIVDLADRSLATLHVLGGSERLLAAE
jgi:uncharacterized protein YhaN